MTSTGSRGSSGGRTCRTRYRWYGTGECPLVSIIVFPPAREQEPFISDRTTGRADGSPAHPGPGRDSVIQKPVLERLDEAECLRLISPGGFGRLAYSGRFGLAVISVNYKLYEGSIVFRTAQDSPPTRTPHRCKGRRVQGGLRDRRRRPCRMRRVERSHPGLRAPRGLRNRGRIDSGSGRRAMARRSQGTLPSHYPHPHHRSAHPPTVRKTVEALSACTTDSVTRVKASAVRAMPRCL
jgi:hypothetical protein